MQALACEDHPDAGQQVWTGEFPGCFECREFGWWCYWRPEKPDSIYGEFVSCGPDHPGAREDLNRLASAFHAGLLRWDREASRWVRP